MRARAGRLIGYREGSCRDFRILDRRMGYMSSSHRDGIRRAIAAREQGRDKVRSTTTAVTMASVVTAGALALVLPGSTHHSTTSTSTSTGSPSTGSSSTNSGSSSSNSGSSGSSSTSSGSSNSSNSSNSSSSGLSSGSSPTSSSGSSQVTSGGS